MKKLFILIEICLLDVLYDAKAPNRYHKRDTTKLENNPLFLIKILSGKEFFTRHILFMAADIDSVVMLDKKSFDKRYPGHPADDVVKMVRTGSEFTVILAGQEIHTTVNHKKDYDGTDFNL